MNDNLAIVVALSSWEMVVARANALFAAFSDEGLGRQIAPGKNSVRYLLGHLTAVHDGLLPLLGLGERLHPELDEAFIKRPEAHDDNHNDKQTHKQAGDAMPSAAELRQYWTEVNSALSAAFASLPPEAWLGRHTAMTDEDYEKNPVRNRLAVLLSRTNHLSYHVGQIILIK